MYAAAQCCPAAQSAGCHGPRAGERAAAVTAEFDDRARGAQAAACKHADIQMATVPPGHTGKKSGCLGQAGSTGEAGSGFLVVIAHLAVVQAQRVAAEMTAERQVRRGGPSTPEQASTALLGQSCRVLRSVLSMSDDRMQVSDNILLLTWAEHVAGSSCVKGLSPAPAPSRQRLVLQSRDTAAPLSTVKPPRGQKHQVWVRLSCSLGLLPASTGSHSLC